jgi:DNA-binding MarR family transcriptional regulator
MTETLHPCPDAETAPSTTSPPPRGAIEELRRSLAHMSAAERRLRGRDHSRPGELSHAQLRAIAALGRNREMTIGEIAKSAELTPATVTVIIDQLEAANIVARERSTQDRRICNVALTPAGWTLLEHKLSNWQALWERELSPVTDAELATAIAVIQQVTAIYDLVTSPADAAHASNRGSAA